MEVLNLKERYLFLCECKERREIAPSMFMSLMQINVGSFTCPGCQKQIYCKIDDTNTQMIERKSKNRSADDYNTPLPDACYRTLTEEEINKLTQSGAAINGATL